MVHPHRASLNAGLSFGLLPSPLSPGFSFDSGGASTSSMTTAKAPPPALPPAAEEKVVVRVRDYAFPEGDERHYGLGVDVPRANRVSRLVRRLGGRTKSVGSVSSSEGGDGEEVEEEEEEDGWSGGGGAGWGGFKMGLGRFSWGGDAEAASVFGFGRGKEQQDVGGYPSRMDLDQNFGGAAEEEEEEEEDVFHDAAEDQLVEEEEEEEEPLYPGLYRALYAFEPEGTAEMRLEEDQIVRVVGRGGGVGWAVVDVLHSQLGDSSVELGEGEEQRKHALVPESYLEPYRLDWEEEEEQGGEGEEVTEVVVAAA